MKALNHKHNTLLRLMLFLAVLGITFFSAEVARAASPSSSPSPNSISKIPDLLKPWEGWALWDAPNTNSPTPYSDLNKPLSFWPSTMGITVVKDSGTFDLTVTVFSETWVPLPGGGDLWPVSVTVDGHPVPVLAAPDRPSLLLEPGVHHVTGKFLWDAIPQRLPIPSEIGLLSLTLEGSAVQYPVWDGNGDLWLKRQEVTESTEKDSLSVKVYSLLQDGIPLLFDTRVELIVSGKGREEKIGGVLPEGWKLSSVNSPIPVAINDAGEMKAQVRPGRWVVDLGTFRTQDARELKFAQGVKPAVAEELLAFKADPTFRLLQITNATSVDASQTTMPEDWRQYPIYKWETGDAVDLVQRLRGMGEQKPQGLSIRRELWLDEDGGAYTFRDLIQGGSQLIWRLDSSGDEDLGAVTSGGLGQLITRNPQTGDPGVEIRTRAINLEAVGRMNASSNIPGSGWNANAESPSVTLHLPPGWRLFALFGADWVHGDWLTAWSLLDLFVLLVFTLAVQRLWGIVPAVIAFAGFALSYHELGAPKYEWLILMIPLALVRVVPQGRGLRVVQATKWIALVWLLLTLLPFITQQLQQTLYPQLEPMNVASVNRFFGSVSGVGGGAVFANGPTDQQAANGMLKDGFQQQRMLTAGLAGVRMAIAASPISAVGSLEEERRRDVDSVSQVQPQSGPQSLYTSQNMQNDIKARIQTGPALPAWDWRVVTYGWNGPVTSAQRVHAILIPLWLERLLALLRVALLLLLAGILLNARSLISRISLPRPRAGTGMALGMIFALFLLSPHAAKAQIPDQNMIDTLKNRLMEASQATNSSVAEIPMVSLKLSGHQLTQDIEVHTAVRTAVPIPGNLPAWSPLSVQLDSKPESALRRDDGFLWVVVPEGIHHIEVTGLIGGGGDWEWNFRLKPRRIAIEAPEWNVSGVRPNGVPEQQILFSLKQKVISVNPEYDNPNLKSLVVLNRTLELGLVWQVHNRVTRLSPAGKAVSLRIPLVPGEQVLTPNAIVKDGCMEIHLAAYARSYGWESELPITNSLSLTSKHDDSWLEQWHLVVSPVWNVGFEGLPPTFDAGNNDLTPVWYPWPGESVKLSVSRPLPVDGATATVDWGLHTITVGARQQISSLELLLHCSLGQDFHITLPAGAEVTSLQQAGQQIPVRMEGNDLVVTLQPGSQSLNVEWNSPVTLGVNICPDAVSLPIESANIETVINLPENRWTLWTYGPRIGPAVQYWAVLASCLLVAVFLGRLSLSPLKAGAWLLLAVGLSQVSLTAALVVVGWFFIFAWRGSSPWSSYPFLRNALQIALVFLTLKAIVVIFSLLQAGLLGTPQMFVAGNGSNASMLAWYQARCGTLLPQPGCLTISIWWYRLSMLLWALWLASSAIRWATWSWRQFSQGGIFLPMKFARRKSPPPPITS